MIAVSVSVMTLAVASFLVVGSNQVAYAASSVALGLGYGLAVPAVQAHAVNVSPDSLRPRVLPAAGLIFQAAILAFPLLVGWIVTSRGYSLLFVVLIAFAFLQAGVAWRQVLRRHHLEPSAHEAPRTAWPREDGLAGSSARERGRRSQRGCADRDEVTALSGCANQPD